MRNILFHFGFERGLLAERRRGNYGRKKQVQKERSYAGKAFTEGMGRQVKWSLHMTHNLRKQFKCLI